MAQFIVIEGLDGAGTTTQVSALATRLRSRGDHVVQTCEPTDRPLGRVIRSTLRAEPGAPSPEALPWMFAADRADHVFGEVKPALTAGSWVVSDRYYHSSLAYQSLTLPLGDVWALNCRFATPDLTVFVDLPVDKCLERVAQRGGQREIYEHEQQLRQIARAYDRVIDHLGGLGHRIERVSGEGSIETVAERIAVLV